MRFSGTVELMGVLYPVGDSGGVCSVVGHREYLYAIVTVYHTMDNAHGGIAPIWHRVPLRKYNTIKAHRCILAVVHIATNKIYRRQPRRKEVHL